MVWLDAGELALLRALYRELITSDDPEIVRRREKVATILMQWEGRERAVTEAARQVDTITSADDFNLLSYLLP